MGKRRTIAAIGAFIFVAIANDAVVRIANWAWALAAGSGAMTWAALLNLIGLAGAAVCLYFVINPGDVSAREQAREKLVERMRDLKDELYYLFDNSRFQPNMTIYGKIAAVYVGIGKFGIMTPSQEGFSQLDVYRHAQHYVRGLLPLIEDGHIADAKREAPRLLAAINSKPEIKKVWWARFASLS